MISNLVIQFPDVGEIPTITTPSQLYPGIKEDGQFSVLIWLIPSYHHFSLRLRRKNETP